MGSSGQEQIKGEFTSSSFENNLKHEASVISMTRSQHPDSASSQFFIMHKDSPHLDGQYAAFGKVIKVMEVVNEIAERKTGRQDRPVKEQIMETVTAEFNGYEYEVPERIE